LLQLQAILLVRFMNGRISKQPNLLISFVLESEEICLVVINVAMSFHIQLIVIFVKIDPKSLILKRTNFSIGAFFSLDKGTRCYARYN
jgi:hypothetical protein